MLPRTLPTLMVVLPALVGACTRVTTFTNNDHCALNEGDRYCAEMFPERPYCVQGQGECALGDQYGCMAEVPAECHEPCGVLGADECAAGSSSGTDTGASSGTGSGSGSGSESSGESSTTGPMPCVSDEECTDPGAPFCGVTGECGACDGTKDPDGACAGVDPLHPLCVEGTCVACTPENPVVCDDQLLLCDEDTNACVPCTEHGQCGSGACELSVGTCFPGDFVVSVDGDGSADYPSVSAAVGAVAAGAHGVIVVHDYGMDGLTPYAASVLVDSGKVIALLAAPGETPILQGTGANPGLRAEGAGTSLYMDGLQVSQATGLGLRVNAARAWADRSRIVQNSGGGVLAESGAELVLRNCFVGGSLDDVDALQVNGATASVLYSTLGSGTFNASALTCNAPIAVDVRNSLLVTRGGTPPDEVACPAAAITYTATEGAVGGEGNAAVGMFPGGSPGDWFRGYTTGDFSLQNQGLTVFADIAQWNTNDPLLDIDGDPRPAVDGTPDYAGADVP